MSKIKSTRLEPRAPQGTLTIGTDEGPSTTQFEGTVILPEYATLEYVDQIVAGDISGELASYQKRDEKNADGGYAGLDASGRVPASRVDTDVIDAEVAEHHDLINTNIAKIEQLEAATAFQIEYYMGDLSGADPSASYMSINAADWASTTVVKLNTTDAGGSTHDYSALTPGDTIWFADITADASSTSIDTSGLYTISSTDITGAICTVDVVMQSSQGAPTVGDRVEAEMFPAFDVSSKADITYVDSQDEYIKRNYLPLSGSTTHKMSGDIYMAQHRVKGIADDPENTQDAVNQKYVDNKFLPLTGGRVDGTITLEGEDRRLNSANGLAGQLAYDNKIKFQWGSVQNVSKQAISMDNHAIHNLYMPTDDKDAANKKYVDDHAATGGGGVEVGTEAIPPARPKGWMYMTTSGTVYIYT